MKIILNSYLKVYLQNKKRNLKRGINDQAVTQDHKL